MYYTPLQLHRRWQYRCWINGSPYSVEGTPSLTSDIDNLTTNITLRMRDIPVYTSYQTLNVEYSFDNGSTFYPLFNGYVLPNQSAIVSYEVHGIDILYKLENTLSSDISLSNTPYLTAISSILTSVGIPASKQNLPVVLPDLITRASICQALPVNLTTKDTAVQVLNELFAFGRYQLYTDVTGTVRIRKYRRVPTATSNIYFSSDDVQDTEYGFYDISNELGLGNKIVSTIVISGDNGDTENPPNATWETSIVEGKSMVISNRFCQSNAQCLELANDIGPDMCREDKLWNIDCPTDTSLNIGSTVMVKSSVVGVSEFQPGCIVQRTVNGPSMTLQLSYGPRVTGFAGSEYSVLYSPIADFNYVIEQEGTNLWGVQVDAVASYSISGLELTYEWAVSGVGEGYPKPAPSNKVKNLFLVDTLDSVGVTLTVTDSEGGSSEITKWLSTETNYYTRQLSLIIDDVWYALLRYPNLYVLYDGEHTPAHVPQYNDTRYWFCLSDDNVILRYDVDNPSNDVEVYYEADTSGVATCIAQGEIFDNPQSGKIVLAGTGNTLYYTLDCTSDTADFSTYVFSDYVTQCAVNPYDPTQFLVSAGSNYYISYDSGENFEILHEATEEIIDFASFPWAPGTALLLDDKVEPEQTTATPTFTGAVSISPGLSEEKLYIAADTDILKQVKDEITILGSINGPLQVTRDGFFEGLLWVGDTGENGFGKFVEDSEYVSLFAATTGCPSFGYGRLVDANEMIGVDSTVFVIPQGESGAADKLWKYSEGAWSGIALPQSEWTWENIVASPTNTDHLLLFGHAGTYYSFDGSLNMIARSTSASPMYYSNNGGTTWSEITLTGTNLNNGGNPVEIIGNIYVDWSASGENAYITAVARNVVGLAGLQKLAYWAGDPSTGTLTGYHPGTSTWVDNRNSYHTAVGPGDDEFYWIVRTGPQFALHYNNGSVGNLGSITGKIKPNSISDISNAEIIPGTSTAVMSGNDLLGDATLWSTSDYTTTLPTLVSGSSYTYAAGYNCIVAAMENGTIFVSGGAHLYKVTSLSPYSQSIVESFVGENVGYVRSDRQSRRAAAARITSGTDIIVYDGLFWERVSGPSGVTNLANSIEVIT